MLVGGGRGGGSGSCGEDDRALPCVIVVVLVVAVWWQLLFVGAAVAIGSRSERQVAPIPGGRQSRAPRSEIRILCNASRWPPRQHPSSSDSCDNDKRLDGERTRTRVWESSIPNVLWDIGNYDVHASLHHLLDEIRLHIGKETQPSRVLRELGFGVVFGPRQQHGLRAHGWWNRLCVDFGYLRCNEYEALQAILHTLIDPIQFNSIRSKAIHHQVSRGSLLRVCMLAVPCQARWRQ
mgnify:CR=1 FL=1